MPIVSEQNKKSVLQFWSQYNCEYQVLHAMHCTYITWLLQATLTSSYCKTGWNPYESTSMSAWGWGWLMQIPWRHLVLEPDPLWEGGRVWTHTYIRVVPRMECWPIRIIDCKWCHGNGFSPGFQCGQWLVSYSKITVLFRIPPEYLMKFEGSNRQIGSESMHGITTDC